MKLVLIDRDGVINEELPHYVKSQGELRIYPEALTAFAILAKHGFTCVVITNQSVVGRGIISQAELDNIHAFMCKKIKEHGGTVADVIVCTDNPDQASYRRKPKPGMLIEALEKYNAKASETVFIGDAITDLEAGHAAGCQRYLVMTGKGEKTQHALPESLLPVTRCKDIMEAAQQIISAK